MGRDGMGWLTAGNVAQSWSKIYGVVEERAAVMLADDGPLLATSLLLSFAQSDCRRFDSSVLRVEFCTPAFFFVVLWRLGVRILLEGKIQRDERHAYDKSRVGNPFGWVIFWSAQDDSKSSRDSRSRDGPASLKCFVVQLVLRVRPAIDHVLWAMP